MEVWATRVASWERSGQGAVEFCKARRLDPAQLRWWRWKLERRGVRVATHEPLASLPERDATRVTFLRLVTADDEPADERAPRDFAPTHCELFLRDGRLLRFDDEVTPERVRALADALETVSRSPP